MEREKKGGGRRCEGNAIGKGASNDIDGRLEGKVKRGGRSTLGFGGKQNSRPRKAFARLTSATHNFRTTALLTEQIEDGHFFYLYPHGEQPHPASSRQRVSSSGEADSSDEGR